MTEYLQDDTTFYSALSDADPAGLEQIYVACRQPIVRAISMAGGTSADAGVFFRTALHDLAENNPALTQSTPIQEESPAVDTAEESIQEEDNIYATAFETEQLTEEKVPDNAPEMMPEEPVEQISVEENKGTPSESIQEASEPDSFFTQLKTRALAHYYDWVEERSNSNSTVVPERAADTTEPDENAEEGSTIQQQEESEISSADKPEKQTKNAISPEQECMRFLRKKLFAWKKLNLLPEKTRQTLRTMAHTLTGREIQPEVRAYTQALQLSSATAQEGLPDWVMAALQDEKGYALWQNTQKIEHRIATGQPIVKTVFKTNRTEWIARFIFFGLLIGTLIWIFYPKSVNENVEEAYNDVFAPPASIMADVEKRYGPSLAFDSVTARPDDCTQALQRADELYKKRNYVDALNEMGDLYENGDNLCQSDALFYLGIIFLQMEEPSRTIACFSKIEDLERYGEDLYWYQALAFVKKSETDPDQIKIAKKALKQAIANTENPERREQAEKMLLKLMSTAHE
jgi:hypothetical protein